MFANQSLSEMFKKSLEKRRYNKKLPWKDHELVRVRAHISRIDRLLRKSTKPVDIVRLAQALSKLYEVAGLPKAGAYRPTDRQSASQVSVEPMD